MKFIIRKASDFDGITLPHPKAKIESWKKSTKNQKIKLSKDNKKLLNGLITEPQHVLHVKDLADLLKLSEELETPLLITAHNNIVKDGYYDSFQEYQICDGAICIYDAPIEQ